MSFSMQNIGLIHSCFREKFGIPRQSGLVAEAHAELEILSPWDRDEAFSGLQAFSHIWVIFVFHQCLRQTWKSTVRPPRLGGNRRVGVFASRATFRPNPIGLSVVKFDGMTRRQGHMYLQISGVDLLDGTPVLDIKPYLPYADSLPLALSGYAPEAPQPFGSLLFSAEAEAQCRHYAQGYAGGYSQLRALIVKLLQLDPRPAYHAHTKTEAGEMYAMRLLDFDLKWEVRENKIHVLRLDSTG